MASATPAAPGVADPARGPFCIEAEVLEVRSHEGASPGVALIRDGNGTRSFETLMRYRGATMAEFWRALRTLP